MEKLKFKFVRPMADGEVRRLDFSMTKPMPRSRQVHQRTGTDDIRVTLWMWSSSSAFKLISSWAHWHLAAIA